MKAQAERVRPEPSSTSDILVVAVPGAPGLSSLPNASLEADAVQQLVPLDTLTTLSGDVATIPAVLEALPRASVLHLACHGHQAQDEPLSSGFSLYDGRLTLERLMHMQLPKAQLAYLSACETASMDEYQPDEVINLAATMLFAGFKSVIATMWYVGLARRVP
jgi:CHAT domain-containing protein